MSSPTRRVIILEDDEDISALFAQLLESYGTVPVLCNTAQDVLKAAQAPDTILALLDIMVPGGDGRDVLSELRKMQVTFPVYFMTGLRESTIGQEYLDLADGILKKPFSITQLRNLLDSALHGGGQKDEASVNRIHLLQAMASIASEQENISRQRTEIHSLLATLENGSTPDPTVLARPLRESLMGLEAVLGRVHARLQDVRKLIDQQE